MKKGFTLVEILVYVCVLTILIGSVYSLFLWVIRSATKAKVMRETLNNARRAMEIMTAEIREAKSVYTPTSAFSTSTGQLSLETKKYLPEGEETTYLDFYLCQKHLCLKKEGEDPIPLTSDNVEVEKLEFNQIATTSTIPSIQIFLKVDYKAPTERAEYQASVQLVSTASLRAY